MSGVDRMAVIAHPTQNDVDALVEFWHNANTERLLDDEARKVLDGLEVTAAADQLRGAVSAARAWLEFDNEVEPPHPDAPYEEHLAYERQKAAITEALAAAIGGQS